MIFLQSHVVAVVLVEKTGVAVKETGHRLFKIKELFGSAFFINGTVFLTAKHVLEGALTRSKETGLQYGLCQKYKEGKSPLNVICEVVAHEFAPAPYDVVIGRSAYKTTTMFTLGDVKPAEWQDVATYGYPLSIVDWDANTPAMIGLRCHKGHIQRVVAAGELKLGPAAPAYELNFNISRGLSGAPLFISGHRDIVVGVCVGSVRSEVIDYERVEVDEHGNKLKESRVKIEEYGLAHDIVSLNSWRPRLLAGKSLLDASRVELTT